MRRHAGNSTRHAASTDHWRMYWRWRSSYFQFTVDGGPVLKFFDVSKPVTISCDALPIAVLLQNGYPAAYASRSLTETESRYVPSTLRKEMLQRIHHGYMGIEKSKRRARDALYWPLINQHITEMVSKCTTCLEHRKENIKEPIIPFRIPTLPWEVVATDLFTLDNSDYLLIVDYQSRYFEVVKSPDTKSATAITYSKSIFSRHGIFAEVVSDNGRQYSSKEYQAFIESWEFKHTKVSTLKPQANGLAETTVQTVNDLLVTLKKDQRDPYLSLVEYRNTPIDDVGSPEQLLMFFPIVHVKRMFIIIFHHLFITVTTVMSAVTTRELWTCSVLQIKCLCRYMRFEVTTGA